MAIITFWSQKEKETSQTYSISAVSTYLSIEHNYRTLLLSTAFNDKSLEGCFWDLGKNNNNLFKQFKTPQNVALDSGIDGLVKNFSSNRNSPEMIQDYTRLVFKDRLEVLFSSNTQDKEEYDKIKSFYPEVVLSANKNYNLIFIDLNKTLDAPISRRILEISDLIVVNITQSLRVIEDFIELRNQNPMFKGNNILLLIGRYDKYSKYNMKNISRYISEKNNIFSSPYNTLFFEACSEGKIADYFLKFRKLDQTDRNAVFINEIKKMSDGIIYKAQELQMKI